MKKPVLRFTHRIALGLLFISVLFIAGGLYILLDFSHVARKGRNIVEEVHPLENLARGAVENLNRVDSDLYAFLLSGDLGEYQQFLAHMDQMEVIIRQLIEKAPEDSSLKETRQLCLDIRQQASVLQETRLNYEANHPVIADAAAYLNPIALSYLGYVDELLEQAMSAGKPDAGLVRLLADLRHSWAQMMSYFRIALATQKQSDLENVRAYLEVNQLYLKELRSHAHGFEIRDFNPIVTLQQEYMIHFKRITDDFENNVWRMDVQLMRGELVPRLEKLKGILSALAEQQTTISVQTLGDYSDQLARSQFIYIGLLIAGIVLVVPLTLLITQGLKKPLRQLAAAAQEVSEGNLSVRVNVQGRDELGILGECFNGMLERLQELMQHKDKVALELGELARKLQFQKDALDEHAIVSITDATGMITYANERFSRVSQYASEELIGKKHNIVKSSMHDKGFYADLWRTIAQGKVWQGEICNRRKDGGLYWVFTTIVPFLGENGKPEQYIAIRTEITKIKESEEELRRARDEAQSSNQAKNQFLRRMTHELRTPLNAILGFGQLLELSVSESVGTDEKEYVDLILKSGWHLLDLLDQAIDLSRLESGDLHIVRTPTDIYPLLHECAESVESEVQVARLHLELDIEGCETVQVDVDITRLKQVVMHLLSNAIKFNRADGSIFLRGYVLNDHVRVEVQDTGAGLDEDSLRKIFEPFNRLNADRDVIEGAGMGLSLSKRFLGLMDGCLGVNSCPGEGSVFWFELPVHQENPGGTRKVAVNHA